MLLFGHPPTRFPFNMPNNRPLVFRFEAPPLLAVSPFLFFWLDGSLLPEILCEFILFLFFNLGRRDYSRGPLAFSSPRSFFDPHESRNSRTELNSRRDPLLLIPSWFYIFFAYVPRGIALEVALFTDRIGGWNPLPGFFASWKDCPRSQSAREAGVFFGLSHRHRLMEGFWLPIAATLCSAFQPRSRCFPS